MSAAKIKGKHKDLSLSHTLETVKLSSENNYVPDWTIRCSQSTISKISNRKDALMQEAGLPG